MRIVLIILTVALVAIMPARAHFDWEAVEIKTTDLGHGLYMLEGMGGNIGLSVGEDGVFMIDDQYAPLTPKILAAIRELTDGPIRYVINTHWHGDHTGGNPGMAAEGAVIVAHDNVRRRMSTEQFSTFFDRATPPSPEEALPVITFSDTVTFHFNGHEILALHLPRAHTDGDTVIHFPAANVIHTGDILFNGMYPFIDVDSGGNIDAMIAAQEMIYELADAETKIIPGHGPLANREDLARATAMLREVRGRIAALIEEGLSVDEVVAADPLADLDEAWAWQFINGERMTRLVYLSLTRE
jgi:cyclase